MPTFQNMMQLQSMLCDSKTAIVKLVGNLGKDLVQIWLHVGSISRVYNTHCTLDAIHRCGSFVLKFIAVLTNPFDVR